MPNTSVADDIDDLNAIKQLAAQVAEERYAPLAAQWDAERTTVPVSERQFLGSLGLLGIALPEEFGGSVAPISHALAVIEQFAYHNRPAAFQIFEANTGPAQVVARLGTQEQKERFLPRITAGDITMAVAARAGVREVLIDVEVGLPRCGCPPEQAGRLAHEARAAGLEVRGVMGYEAALGFVFILTALSFALAGMVILFVREPFTPSRREGFLRHGIEGCRMAAGLPRKSTLHS